METYTKYVTTTHPVTFVLLGITVAVLLATVTSVVLIRRRNKGNGEGLGTGIIGGSLAFMLFLAGAVSTQFPTDERTQMLKADAEKLYGIELSWDDAAKLEQRGTIYLESEDGLSSVVVRHVDGVAYLFSGASELKRVN